MGRCCGSRQAWSLHLCLSLQFFTAFGPTSLQKENVATIAVTQGRSGAKEETLQPINAVSFTHFQEENTLLRTLIRGLYDQN